MRCGRTSVLRKAPPRQAGATVGLGKSDRRVHGRVRVRQRAIVREACVLWRYQPRRGVGDGDEVSGGAVAQRTRQGGRVSRSGGGVAGAANYGAGDELRRCRDGCDCSAGGRRVRVPRCDEASGAKRQPQTCRAKAHDGLSVVLRRAAGRDGAMPCRLERDRVASVPPERWASRKACRGRTRLQGAPSSAVAGGCVLVVICDSASARGEGAGPGGEVPGTRARAVVDLVRVMRALIGKVVRGRPLAAWLGAAIYRELATGFSHHLSSLAAPTGCDNPGSCRPLCFNLYCVSATLQHAMHLSARRRNMMRR